MSSYLYRVDRKIHLRQIKDGKFRANKWQGGPYDFRHAELRRAALSTPLGKDIYRICFYSTHERAVQSLNIDYAYLGDGVITRVRHDDVLALGFFETRDDGFSPGEAYLFWKYEQGAPDDPQWSASGIPLTALEVSSSSGWSPFTDLLER